MRIFESCIVWRAFSIGRRNIPGGEKWINKYYVRQIFQSQSSCAFMLKIGVKYYTWPRYSRQVTKLATKWLMSCACRTCNMCIYWDFLIGLPLYTFVKAPVPLYWGSHSESPLVLDHMSEDRSAAALVGSSEWDVHYCHSNSIMLTWPCNKHPGNPHLI